MTITNVHFKLSPSISWSGVQQNVQELQKGVNLKGKKLNNNDFFGQNNCECNGQFRHCFLWMSEHSDIL